MVVYSPLLGIVIPVDRPGDVLVSGNECLVCLELIQLYGSADYVVPWLCNCIIESESEIELPFQSTLSLYINPYWYTTLDGTPLSSIHRVPKAD